MAGLQRHPSLRFSVFELAADIGLEGHAFDGNFDVIVEEEDHQGSLQTLGKQQRRTHSSDELTDPPYPLTPPSSNIALYSPRPVALGNKKLDEQAKFVERFPTRSPDFLSSPPKGRPATPRSASGKLRKTPTSSAANTPISEALLDFTDSERPRSRKDKDKKAPREEKEREKFAKGLAAQRDNTSGAASQSLAEDDEEKKLLGGLLRFRTRSKERKAAAKQAQQKLPFESQNGMPPPRQHTPPPLPIASRFARQKEEISFRPQTSESSHGGHQGSSNHSQVASSDSHDIYPRPRDRSSRFERPHPVWRSGPSMLGNIGNVAPREDKERVLPAERHTLPPHQSIFDREPAKRPLRIDISNDGNNGGVNMEAVNKYYGLTPEPTHTPAAVTTPNPQGHFTLAQALEPIEPRPNGNLLNASRSTFAPSPSSPSPFLVPSPNPAQSEFGAQPRAKRGRMNLPPALDPTFVLPRRLGGTFNPPPTPPPTTDLPPIPTHIPDDPPRYSPYPPAPPSAMRPASTLPLKTRTSNPNLRVEPSTPSPLSPAHHNRTGEISAQDSGMAPPAGAPLRSLSPVQRGKTPAFPARPVTPTKQLHVSPVSPARSGNGVGYRREYDPSVPVPHSQKSSLSTEENGFLRRSRSQQQLAWNNADQYSMPSHVDMQSSSNGGNDGISPIPPARKRSVRKSNHNQSGYDSDDASSRYSRDTYYGRETAYFDDQNMPPLPLPSDMLPLPQRDFGDMERERKAGRERLVRMLANGGRVI